MFLFSPGVVFAYPSSERVQLDFSFGDDPSGFVISDDNRYLIYAVSQTWSIVDLADFTKPTGAQPPALSTTDETDGVIQDLVFYNSTNEVYGCQDDGDIIRFDLDDLTKDIVSTIVSKDADLGPMAIDPDGDDQIYIIENATKKLHVFEADELIVSRTVSLATGDESFSVLDIITVKDASGGTDRIYMGTDDGRILYIDEGGSTVSAISIDTTNKDDIVGLAATPTSSKLYALNSTDKTVIPITISTNALGTALDVSLNGAPTHIAITDVTNPTGAYSFVSGPNGVTVFDTSDDDIFDLGATSTDDEPLALSSSAIPKKILTSGDKYVYTANGNGTISVLSDNPYVTLSSATPSGSDTTLGVGETLTVTFQSDETGTYAIRMNGDITGTGTLVASGTVSTAATAVAVDIAYDSNSSAFAEGTNRVFVFVTDSATSVNTGRDSTTLTVDTPPPAVTINSVRFGNKKLYIDVTRLTQADMKQYNAYVDTRAATLGTGSINATSVQPSSGSTVTITVPSLTNGTAYFVAVEAQDNNNNVSTSKTTTLASGASASGTPEATLGPAAFAGETGCNFIILDRKLQIADFRILGWIIFVFIFLGIFRFFSFIGNVIPAKAGIHYSLKKLDFGWSLPRATTRGRNDKIHMFGHILLLFLIISAPDLLFAAGKSWGVEVQSGLWMPTAGNTERFFSSCCNMRFAAEGGWFYESRYGIVGQAGFLMKNGKGQNSAGAISGDSFEFMMFPVQASFVYQAEYTPQQPVVPFIKTGTDYVYFRDKSDGVTTQGYKIGLHAGGGLQILLDTVEAAGDSFEDSAFQDVYLTLGAEYDWIDSFGKRGLNLSGPVYTAGLLFEF